MSFDNLLTHLKPMENNLNDRVLLIDGLNTFLRSFNVSPHMNNIGMHVGGLTGFLKSIGAIIREVKPTRVIIIFDGKNSSQHRKKIFPDYKAGRRVKLALNRADHMKQMEDPEESAKQQIIRLMAYLKALPVSVVIADGIEADDTIAYYTNTLLSGKVIIYSSDKDFFQLINDRVIVYNPHYKRVTAERLKERFNVYPNNYLHYKCFVGDSSDNIKGVMGFGKKTIFKYFPEMAGSMDLTRDYFETKANELKTEKKGKVNAYGKFLNQLDTWDLNTKIMSLHEPLIPAHTKTIIRNMFDISPNKLNSGRFIELLKEDEIQNFVSMPHVWVRQTWIPLQRS